MIAYHVTAARVQYNNKETRLEDVDWKIIVREVVIPSSWRPLARMGAQALGWAWMDSQAIFDAGDRVTSVLVGADMVTLEAEILDKDREEWGRMVVVANVEEITMREVAELETIGLDGDGSFRIQG